MRLSRVVSPQRPSLAVLLAFLIPMPVPVGRQGTVFDQFDTTQAASREGDFNEELTGSLEVGLQQSRALKSRQSRPWIFFVRQVE